MRLNSEDWSITVGVKAGHDHVRHGLNCHDAAVICAGESFVVGVACDGCGVGDGNPAGVHSELGSISTANLAARYLQRRLRETDPSHPCELLPPLFRYLCYAIEQSVRTTCFGYDHLEIANFIKYHWLSTIMGVVALRGQVLVFWCGDGVYAVDAVLKILDYGPCPPYLAYNCLENPALVGVDPKYIPTEFDWICFPVSDAQRVMIATDGFTKADEAKLFLAREKEPHLTTDLHGQQWDKKGQFGLKKWMNTRWDRGYFSDDCAIITVEQRLTQGAE